MINVDTSIEPPGLDIAADEEDRPLVLVTVSLSEADSTHRSGSITLAGDSTDVEIADALIACLRGCATMRGPGLVAAIERRIR